MKKAIPLFLATLLAGCGADLKPAPSASTVPGMEEAARDSVQGVKVTVQANAWPGRVPIQQEVTPMRLVVENNSGKPLRIAYNLFALVGPGGERFSALPPLQIEGTVQTAATAPGHGPIADSKFGYTGFEVAPAYGPYYPGIRPFRGAFYPDYYSAYSPSWREIELPTEEMVQRAVPEGVLNSGGRLEGYLYFEKVTGDVKRVNFRADLVNAESGIHFGEIRVPFVVD